MYKYLFFKKGFGVYRLKFAVHFLLAISRAKVLSSRLTMNLTEDTPLLVEYEVRPAVARVRYFLAPKV